MGIAGLTSICGGTGLLLPKHAAFRHQERSKQESANEYRRVIEGSHRIMFKDLIISMARKRPRHLCRLSASLHRLRARPEQNLIRSSYQTTSTDQGHSRTLNVHASTGVISVSPPSIKDAA